MDSRIVDASADDALGDFDAVALLERLSRREVCPAELRAAALDRGRSANPTLNAVVDWVESDPQPSASHGPDAPLGGLPTAIKNNEDLAGYPTLQGSWAIPRRAAREHSPWVAQALRLGISPIATTTMPEFGLTASTESSRFGATANPRHHTHTAGGSSGGAAALVAARVVPIAHANDGGGSIRTPASCCGLVGLKPSRGRTVDRPEVDRLPVAIVAQGVLTRTVRDTALYWACAETAYRNPALPPIGHVRAPGRRRLRVGLVTDPPNGIAVSPEVVQVVTSAGRLLDGLGHHVEPVDVGVDDRFGPDFLIYWQLLAYGLIHGGRRLFGRDFDPTRVEPLTWYLAGRLPGDLPRVPGVLRRLRRLASEHEHLFRRFDLVLSPVLAHPPPPLGHLGPDVEPRTHLVRLIQWTAFTPLQNVSGSPAIALPLGQSACGLPIGAQLGAPFGHEQRLLEVAFELEAATRGFSTFPS